MHWSVDDALECGRCTGVWTMHWSVDDALQHGIYKASDSFFKPALAIDPAMHEVKQLMYMKQDVAALRIAQMPDHKMLTVITSGNRTPGSRFYSDLLDTLADSVYIHQLALKRRSKR